ncbi:putative lipid II flippase FtsW [Salinibacterium soli]|uniref:Probable peptidoglycan glycosyltransferase FtsW n=1 Tax=Antiquaquibacter soli TaxID=3064523 RepID=A0ABT9BR72_9MICO|nr:putative lipid II flippase FtsW [Protaetiibacter sp. WY-16]MDO7881832.1 putative lipid II flippase FtsW [Protaetiibacter sp. WY-16]
MTTTRHPSAARRAPRPQPDTGRPAGARIPLARLFTAENRNYYLLMGVTLFLVAFGLVMVLSSSFVTEISADASPFGVFVRQSLYAIIGIPLMLVASRMPSRFWKRWAWPALLVGGALQLLVFIPGIGWGYGGNQNWIQIGGVNAQPSEFVKIALIVWIAWVLSAKQDLLGDWKHVALPIAPVAGIAILFVLIGNDLGTAMIMILIVLGCLFFAGVRLRFLGVAVIGIAILGAMFAMASSSRSSRISTWLNGCTEQDYSGTCWQVLHGTWALANGGIFGVGLGNSKAAWNWLPHAESDFIFAIIGEELGLVGATVVLILFVILAIAFIRIIRSTGDPFARITTAGVMVWVIGQAFVNIAVVLGVLPVLGVPLPLISAGGSALIANLLGIGVVLSLARRSDRDTSEVVQPAFGARLMPSEGMRRQ